MYFHLTMVKVYSKPLEETIEVERIIGEINGALPGPTVIFTAGIHGNEASGIFALNKVIENLKPKEKIIRGNIIAISGNLKALAQGIRFNNRDLNRIWTQELIDDLLNGTLQVTDDEAAELEQIYSVIERSLSRYPPPYYFMDLHTTSSESIPFLTVNDSSLNRDFVKQYPLPIIFGIEEFIQGPILSYINELGYVSFGFEGGQHDSLSSIDNHEAFIYLTLVYASVINKKVADYHHHFEVLAKSTVDSQGFYEVYDKLKIKEGQVFKMKPGFVNFQTVRKNQALAQLDGNKIIAQKTAKIFMPLYQAKGDDGYYLIRRIPKFFLRLSRMLRKFKFDHLLVLLPGINWANRKKNTLLVNLKVARFFAKKLFHLLGYRSIQKDKTHLILNSREAAARTLDYADAKWRAKHKEI